MMIRSGLALLLMGLPGLVLAEHGCPDGYIPVFQGGTQNRTCVVDYSLPYWQEQGQGPPSSLEQWENRWGAIASDGQATYGIVTDRLSKADAARLAVAECNNRGGGACRVDRTFMNQCAAVIAGERSSASANAPTEEEAIKMGTEACMSNGEASCRVYYSGCSLPARIQ
jgi:hypothetical protein